MMRTAFLTSLAVASLAVGAACSSGPDTQPGPSNPPPNDGGLGLDGTPDGRGSDGGHRDDGSTLHADTGPPSDAAALDAAALGDVAVTPPTDAAMLDPTCSPKTQYGAPTNVAGVPGFTAQPLVTMTNDELTLAWVIDGGGGKGTVFVADRASAGAAFGSANQVPSSMTGTQVVDGSVVDAGDSFFAFDRVAVSSDGLKLIGVAVGGLAMAQFTRPDRGSAFSSPPFEPPFVTLAQTLMPGELLGDPVLAASGDDLVYSKYGKSPTLSVYETFLGGQNWPSGAGQSTAALAGTSGLRKRPTSLTADRRTLFVWDEAGQAYGVLRETPTSQFNYPISFGSRFSIQVNGDCTRLYYVAPDHSGGYVLVQSNAM